MVACALRTERLESQDPDATNRVLMDSIHTHNGPSGEKNQQVSCV